MFQVSRWKAVWGGGKFIFLTPRSVAFGKSAAGRVRVRGSGARCANARGTGHRWMRRLFASHGGVGSAYPAGICGLPGRLFDGMLPLLSVEGRNRAWRRLACILSLLRSSPRRGYESHSFGGWKRTLGAGPWHCCWDESLTHSKLFDDAETYKVKLKLPPGRGGEGTDAVSTRDRDRALRLHLRLHPACRRDRAPRPSHAHYTLH